MHRSPNSTGAGVNRTSSSVDLSAAGELHSRLPGQVCMATNDGSASSGSTFSSSTFAQVECSTAATTVSPQPPSSSATDKRHAIHSRSMYYDPLLALSLCHCAKQQQQQQQQHNNGKSGHCYPFRWPSSAVASPTTVTYPQLHRPPGSESSN